MHTTATSIMITEYR